MIMLYHTFFKSEQFLPTTIVSYGPEVPVFLRQTNQRGDQKHQHSATGLSSRSTGAVKGMFVRVSTLAPVLGNPF